MVVFLLSVIAIGVIIGYFFWQRSQANHEGDETPPENV